MMDLDQITRRRKEAELVVIAAAAYCAADTARLLVGIQPEDFDWDDHQDFWRRLGQVFEERGKAPLAYVTAKGGLQSVSDAAGQHKAAVTSPVAPEPLESFLAVLAMCKLHGTLAKAREEVTQLDATTEAVRDFVDVQEFALKEATVGMASKEPPLGVVDLALGALQTAASDWEATYGIMALDRATAGLRPGTFHVVIAPTAHGKSSLALTAAYATAKRGLRALYVTKEMSRAECSLRWAAMATGIPRNTLEAKARAGEDLRELFARSIPSKLVPRDDLATPMAIAAEVQRAEVEGDPYHLVVVDYVQQYKGPGKSATECIDSAVDVLKTMALQRGVAVLAPAQLNRDQDEGEIPQRSNIRGSGAIEQWADVVVAMRKSEAAYTLSGQPHYGPSHTAAAFGVHLAIRKARNAQECTLWGDGTHEEPLKMGAGTFMIYDSKHAPYSHEPDAVAERNVRDHGSHTEPIP